MLQSPRNWGVAKLARQRTLDPSFEGSSPSSPAKKTAADRFSIGGGFVHLFGDARGSIVESTRIDDDFFLGHFVYEAMFICDAP